jgi:hypothetical protein
MASMRTLRKSLKVIDRLTQIFGSEISPFPVMFDTNTGSIVSKWEGSGSLVEARKKGPGVMEQIFQELPLETLRRFVIFSKAPEVEPAQKEWKEFETKLLTTAQRVVIRRVRQQFKRPLEALPRPNKKKWGRGRPRLNRERPILVRQTIEQWLDSGECKTITEAVEKAAKLFGDGKTPRHMDTIWRYLRHAGRVGPRSSKSSAR